MPGVHGEYCPLRAGPEADGGTAPRHAEGDRKAYYETSQWTIKQNRETILSAKAENKELRTQMATMRIDLSKRGQKVRVRAPAPCQTPRPNAPLLRAPPPRTEPSASAPARAPLPLPPLPTFPGRARDPPAPRSRPEVPPRGPSPACGMSARGCAAGGVPALTGLLGAGGRAGPEPRAGAPHGTPGR